MDTIDMDTTGWCNRCVTHLRQVAAIGHRPNYICDRMTKPRGEPCTPCVSASQYIDTPPDQICEDAGCQDPGNFWYASRPDPMSTAANQQQAGALGVSGPGYFFSGGYGQYGFHSQLPQYIAPWPGSRDEPPSSLRKGVWVLLSSAQLAALGKGKDRTRRRGSSVSTTSSSSSDESDGRPRRKSKSHKHKSKRDKAGRSHRARSSNRQPSRKRRHHDPEHQEALRKKAEKNPSIQQYRRAQAAARNPSMKQFMLETSAMANPSLREFLAARDRGEAPQGLAWIGKHLVPVNNGVAKSGKRKAKPNARARAKRRREEAAARGQLDDEQTDDEQSGDEQGHL